MITESTETVRTDETSVSWGSSFSDDFWVGRDSLLVSISESTGIVCADQSRHQLKRQSRLLFLSRQLLSFQWRLLRQQGLCAQTKPSVSWGSSCGDDFWVGSDSVFDVDFGVNWDCGRWPIQASTLEVVSFIISELSATQFLMTTTESTGIGCTDEPRLQLCRQSRWLFLSCPLLCYRWRLSSQQGHHARTNPGFSGVGSLVDYFWVVR